ncbi:MAG: MFS transporter [Dokdonella sp.]|uniref:MFS transporter n=1 Tax=Dokdonella sp. TaxID=2291710 RepID=UPI0025BABD7F|nr:MFS transporter [Dokdonella sp.]MBX3700991.1 MFS transporter [Dokdonella sp.]
MNVSSTTAARPLTAAQRRGSMIAVIATAAIFGLTYGLSAPLIADNLAERGAGEALIGANAAMHALGVLLIAPFLPRLAVRFGQRALIIAALLLSAGALALFPWLTLIWLWFPLRLLLGVGGEVLGVLSETWTNDLADTRSRGRTMAIYMAALSLGYAGGPAILSVVGTDRLAYVIGAAIALLAIVPVASPWTAAPAPMSADHGRPWRYLRLAPVALMVTVLNAAVETAGLSFVALYAGNQGWNEAAAMRLVTTLMIGAIALQLPIGWLADRMSRPRLVMLLAIASAIGALCWPYVLAFPWLAYATVFVWGGVFVGIYTVMLALVGERFGGAELVGIYAMMGLAWGVGALIGPASVGIGMQLSPVWGLPGVIAAGCALFALFMASRRGSA